MQKYGTWTQLHEPSSNEEILTRHDPEHPLDFWRGRDSHGRYLFALEGLKLPVKDVPSLEGIATSCESSPDDKFSLRLTLENAEDLPLFSALSQDLTSATSICQMEDNDAGAAIVVTRLIRWQKMLKKRRSRLLSKSEIVGLFGEVSFLVNVLFESISISSAVKSWRGGFGDEQDFAFNNLIIEAKTVGATSDATIRISSEHQLDTASGDIAVRYQTVTETEPGIEGLRR